MARKKTPAPEPMSTPGLPVEVIHAGQNLMAEQEAELIEQWGEGLPYVREHYMAEIRRDMARTVESVLAIGRRLIVMKAMEPHGSWIECLGSIGIGEDNAQRMMAAARRIAGLPNTATSRHLLDAVGSPSKLFDLLALPDEQLMEIAAGGEAAGIDLDDVATMTVRELRGALREARADNDTLQERNAKLIEQVEKAQQKASTAARKWRSASVDEQRAELERNVQEAALAVRAAIAREGAEPGVGLHGAVIMLTEHADSNGQDVRGFLADIYAQLIEEVQLSRDDEDWPVAIPVRGSAEG